MKINDFPLFSDVACGLGTGSYRILCQPASVRPAVADYGRVQKAEAEGFFALDALRAPA